MIILIGVIFVFKCWMEVTVNGWSSIGTLSGCVLGIAAFAVIIKCDISSFFAYMPILYIASAVTMLLLKTPLGLYMNGVRRHLGYHNVIIFTPSNLLVIATLGALAYFHNRKHYSKRGELIWIVLEFSVIIISGELLNDSAHISLMIYFLLISSLYVMYSMIKSLRAEYVVHMLGLYFGWSSILFKMRLRWRSSEPSPLFKNIIELRAEALERGGMFGTGAPSEFLISNMYVNDEKLFAFAETWGWMMLGLFY